MISVTLNHIHLICNKNICFNHVRFFYVTKSVQRLITLEKLHDPIAILSKILKEEEML